MDRDMMIRDRLVHNHVPSLPATLAGACGQAIDAVVEGDPDRMIDLWAIGVDRGPARAIVEAFHLDGFVETEQACPPGEHLDPDLDERVCLACGAELDPVDIFC